MSTKQKTLLSGNEAIARGAYEAGCKVSSAYPGTPSTEISENIVKYKEIYAEWAPNEKVAMEVAMGASFAGVRAIASMKHVGVNVAADPLYSVAYAGVNGGLILVAADDPGMYSSQNEQDSRMVARAANVPVLEPSDSDEALQLTKAAFLLSEKYDTPIMLRTTTRLSHSQGVAALGEREIVEDKPYVRNPQKYVMMPGNAKLRHPIVEKRMADMAKDLAKAPYAAVFHYKNDGDAWHGTDTQGKDRNSLINIVEYRDQKIGFITSGIAYQYVREAMPTASVLKLGLVNPLPKAFITEFVKNVEKLYIFEELEPVIEEQVRSWGIAAIGKELFTRQGEYSANLLRERVLGQRIDAAPVSESPIPPRPPILCPGCPHRAVYTVLNKLKIKAAGDIGCYTLGAQPPLSVIDTTICMGSGISSLHGMEKAKGREFIKDWVAVIGDSTFLHTGINSLMNMAYNKATGTVIILDNSTTGMTGHQEHAATGKCLNGEATYAIDLKSLCKAMGIENVYEVNAFDEAGLTSRLKEELNREAVSVIITKSPCVLIKGINFPNKCRPVDGKCVNCGMCLKPGCPALTKGESGGILIDEKMCNGCGLCQTQCKVGAIETVEM